MLNLELHFTKLKFSCINFLCCLVVLVQAMNARNICTGICTSAHVRILCLRPLSHILVPFIVQIIKANSCSIFHIASQWHLSLLCKIYVNRLIKVWAFTTTVVDFNARVRISYCYSSTNHHRQHCGVLWCLCNRLRSRIYFMLRWL